LGDENAESWDDQIITKNHHKPAVLAADSRLSFSEYRYVKSCIVHLFLFAIALSSGDQEMNLGL